LQLSQINEESSISGNNSTLEVDTKDELCQSIKNKTCFQNPDGTCKHYNGTVITSNMFISQMMHKELAESV